MTPLHEVLRYTVGSVEAACQLVAALVIVIGVTKALWIFLKDAFAGGESATAIRETRLELGHSLSLALGFLIGGSILRTTLTPTWNDIGQLATIIAIRTILNGFLLREIAVHANEDVGQPSSLRRLFRRGHGGPEAGPTGESGAPHTIDPSNGASHP